MSTVNIVQLAKGAKPTSLTDNFLIKREDVYTGFKTPATRNFFISASSIAAGKETNVTALPTKITSTLDATYDTSTSVTGSLSMSTAGQSQAIKNLLKCKNITVVTINMNNQAGQPTTSISVNGQAVTPTTEINIPEFNGGGGTFSNPAITVSVANSRVPGGGLSNVAATFTKTSQVDVNSQEVIVLPGRWQVISQANFNSAVVVDNNGSVVGSEQVDGSYVEKDDLLLFIPNLTDNNADIDNVYTRFPITGVTIDTSEEFLNRFHGQATGEINAATYLIPARSSGTPTMTLSAENNGCFQSRPGLLTIGLRWVSA